MTAILMESGGAASTVVMMMLLKGAVVIGLMGGLALLLRNRGPGTRHATLSLGLVSLLLLPALSAVLPNWTPKAIDARMSASRTTDPGGGNEVAGAQHAFAGEHLDSSPHTRPRPGAHVLLLLLWACGVLVLLALCVFALLSRRWLVQRSGPVESHVTHALLADLQDQLGISRPVRLLQSRHAHVPVTWGTVRPVVLLPQAAGSWPASMQRSVLLHELCHIKRADHAVASLCMLSSILHWINPFVWCVLRSARREQEKACDDWVLSMGADPRVYAAHLVEVARGAPAWWTPAVGGVAMARRLFLEERIMSVLENRTRRAGLRWQEAALVITFCAMLVTPLAALTTARPARLSEPAEGVSMLRVVLVGPLSYRWSDGIHLTEVELRGELLLSADTSEVISVSPDGLLRLRSTDKDGAVVEESEIVHGPTTGSLVAGASVDAEALRRLVRDVADINAARAELGWRSIATADASTRAPPARSPRVPHVGNARSGPDDIGTLYFDARLWSDGVVNVVLPTLRRDPALQATGSDADIARALRSAAADIYGLLRITVRKGDIQLGSTRGDLSVTIAEIVKDHLAVRGLIDPGQDERLSAVLRDAGRQLHSAMESIYSARVLEPNR